MWSEVHIDDLVDGYVRIVEAPRTIIQSEIFNFADDSQNTNFHIAKTFTEFVAVSVLCSNSPIQISVDGVIAPMSNKTVLVEWRKAKRILGWQPNHRPLLDPVQIKLLFQTWKASESQIN
jgi:nucleoside-diphosphate-sugar epimerase